MIRGLNNAKSISDAGWGMLRQMSEYKQLKRSHRYVEVSARNTTQTCSTCGEYAYPPLELKDRVFRCPNGHVEDRDINAARNVVARALAAVGQDMPEFTPVETGPPPARMGRRVRSKKQEPPQNTLTAQCVL
ncbi:MAG: transposase [Methanomassiliicoccales archaeon]|nr:transposase [Methanomassiliicoccales archaeon]